MKLQYLIVIFIIIALPIIFVTSYYIKIQVDTVGQVNLYNSSLNKATHEAITSYELNSIDLNYRYSAISELRRNYIEAAINSFYISMSNSLVSGKADKSLIQEQVPAIAFTMYDGLYIHTKGTDGFVLKPFIPYTAFASDGSSDLTINFSLDNYIRIYGKLGGQYIRKEGYLIDIGDAIISNGNILNLEYNGIKIDKEKLKEKVMVKSNVVPGNSDNQNVAEEEANYIYEKGKNKVYIEGSTRFLLDNNDFQQVLNDDEVSLLGIYYKQVAVPVYASGKWDVQYYYQVLNGLEKGKWIKEVYDIDGILTGTEEIDDANKAAIGLNQISLEDDCSAINYFVEAYVFTKWYKDNIIISNAREELIIDSTNKIEEELSKFNTYREDVIENTIENELNKVITSIRGYDQFKLPKIKSTEWEQVLKNISIITFFQGVPAGTKIYNGYAIATSTRNKEYVDPNNIYMINNGIGITDLFYHKKDCGILEGIANPVANYTGYKSIEFSKKGIKYKQTEPATGIASEEKKFYYMHLGDSSGITACYDCIVQSNYTEAVPVNAIIEKNYYNALYRERYVQKK